MQVKVDLRVLAGEESYLFTRPDDRDPLRRGDDGEAFSAKLRALLLDEGLVYRQSELARFATLGGALRLRRVERTDGELAAVFYNEYLDAEVTKRADHVIVEHGTLPSAEIYWELKEGSVNLGEVDLDALIAGTPQEIATNPAGEYQLFRVGDAVSGRNIHAALYDSRRLCMAL